MAKLQVLEARWDADADGLSEVAWLHGELLRVKGVTSVGNPAPGSLAVVGTYRPTWCIVLAVLLFPIGLFFLLAKQPYTFQIRSEPSEAGSQLVLDGRIPAAMTFKLRDLYYALQGQ